jgi:spermidine synthase
MTKQRSASQSAAESTPSGPGNPPGQRLQAALWIAAAFLAGAAVMLMELAGNRILAPWFGNTLYTWTGLIGVVLVSLSCGYYLGGYVADRWPRPVVLAHLLAAAAVLTILIPVLQAAVADWMRTLDVVWGPVLAATLLLAAPGCLLAAVSPLAVRLLSLRSGDRKVGVSAGAVGMAGALGSVLGTFAAGFVLIPHLDLRQLFLTSGGVLAAAAAAQYVACLARPARGRTLAIFFLCLLGAAAPAAITGRAQRPGIKYEQMTFYHRIRVIESPDEEAKMVRYLFLDNTCEGAQYVEPADGELPMPYQRCWRLGPALVPGLERAAFLGGGAFGMPEALLDALPRAEADVLEIDPQVIQVGRQFFRVDRFPRMHPIAEDARRWLQRSERTYDFIVGDAYRGVHSIPPHLATVEFFELVKSRLSPRGVYAMNVLGALEGDKAALLEAVARTLREAFPHVYVLALEPEQPGETQNVIFLAATRKLDIEALAAAQRAAGGESDALGQLLRGYIPWDRLDIPPGPILRDDYNPVEYLAARDPRVN